MLVRDAMLSDLAAIVAIYNHAIETTVATFDLLPYSVTERGEWFAQFGAEHPLLVCEDAGSVAGFAYYTPFRTKAAYATSKETTVYVDALARRRGIATRLYQALIERARERGVHALIAVLGGDNPESVGLHQRLGFSHVGSLREIGHKFGAFVDTHYYQRLL